MTFWVWRQAYGEVDPDGSRYLLGDHTGRLYLLVLVKDQGSVSGLKLEPLGTTSAASTLSCASPFLTVVRRVTVEREAE